MTAIQEFLIQSNIPVLILTITIVCIVVLGYLEYRNVTERFDMIENRFDALTKKVKGDIQFLEGKLKNGEGPLSTDKEVKEVKEVVVEEPEKEEHITHLPSSLERMDPVQAMFSSMAGAGLMGGQPVMMEIPPSGNTFNGFKFEEEQILSETGSHVSEKDNQIEEVFEKLKGDKEVGADKKEEKEEKEDKEDKEEEYDTYSEGSYSDETAEEEEKDEKDEETKVENISINDRMSVSELKAICKSKDLSVSGNKAQLIKRINDK